MKFPQTTKNNSIFVETGVSQRVFFLFVRKTRLKQICPFIIIYIPVYLLQKLIQDRQLHKIDIHIRKRTTALPSFHVVNSRYFDAGLVSRCFSKSQFVGCLSPGTIQGNIYVVDHLRISRPTIFFMDLWTRKHAGFCGSSKLGFGLIVK